MVPLTIRKIYNWLNICYSPVSINNKYHIVSTFYRVIYKISLPRGFFYSFNTGIFFPSP